MKVGSLVYATDSGLGILAKAFYDHGVVTDVMVVRHGRHPTHDEWYPGAAQISNLRSPETFGLTEAFCRTMDVMLFFETPYLWSLLPFCKAHNVKTVIMPMHECMPRVITHQPDLWLCPSQLDMRWAMDQFGKPGFRCADYLPVPVEVPWRQRERAEVFVHNAGHGGGDDGNRNGTRELLAAIPMVKSPARFLVRSQSGGLKDRLRQVFVPTEEKTIGGDVIIARNAKDQRLYYWGGSIPHDKLWTEGDVFVFPEKFNGLSLPLQEARAAGMLVMATDRFPMNTWLPNKVETTTEANIQYRTFSSPLIPTRGSERKAMWPRHGFGEIDCALIDPKDIAAKIDEWYDRDISEYSQQGRDWAQQNSWEVLGPKYKQLLEDLCG